MAGASVGRLLRKRGALVGFKVDTRARLPKGQGIWPAIWPLGTICRDPDCGEIDIMEYVWSSPKTAWSTLHFPRPRKGLHLQTQRWLHRPRSARWRMAHLHHGVRPRTHDLLLRCKPSFTYDFGLANRPDGTNPFRAPPLPQAQPCPGRPLQLGRYPRRGNPAPKPSPSTTSASGSAPNKAAPSVFFSERLRISPPEAPYPTPGYGASRMVPRCLPKNA